MLTTIFIHTIQQTQAKELETLTAHILYPNKNNQAYSVPWIKKYSHLRKLEITRQNPLKSRQHYASLRLQLKLPTNTCPRSITIALYPTYRHSWKSRNFFFLKTPQIYIVHTSFKLQLALEEPEAEGKKCKMVNKQQE